MIELLKEQVYHGNVVSSMDKDKYPELQELHMTSADHAAIMADTGATSIMDQLALLHHQIISQQNQSTSQLNDSLKEVSNSCLGVINEHV